MALYSTCVSGKYYRESAGDTCVGIAVRRFGMRTGAISFLNPGFICANSRLYINQRLCLPTARQLSQIEAGLPIGCSR
jgi:LysM domain